MSGLKAELENRLDRRIASLATREDLERVIAPLVIRDELREEIRTELAAHARTIEEMFRRYFGALDDSSNTSPTT